MKTIKTLALLMLSLNAAATVVRFETTIGNFDIELYEDDAPITAQNFLNYVNDGDYDGTIIHRSIPGFVVQGGGFTYTGNGNFSLEPTHATIVNEAGIPNQRKTIGMARNDDPNSATNQWFINLVNNPSLNPGGATNAGYAVFGEVINGFDVVELIASLQVVAYSAQLDGSPANFVNLPVHKFMGQTLAGTNPPQVSSNSSVDTNSVIRVNRAFVLADEFPITEGLSGAWFNPETNGQGFYLEGLPSAGTIIMAWFTFDATTPDPEVPSTVGDASNRWLTAAGNFDGNVFAGQLLQTGNGLFDDPTAVVNTVVGDVSIVFQDCGHAILSYVLNESGLNNTVDIQRISGANIEFCENLADQANPGITAQ